MENTELQDHRDLQKARLGVYDLLRCFFLQEPSEAFLQALKEEDVLKNLTGYHPDLDEGVGLLCGVLSSPRLAPLVPDLRREFNRLLAGPSPIPLHESVYRSAGGRRTPEQTLAVRRKYLEAGLAVHPDRSAPEDHIGAELEFVFYLCQRGSQAKGEEELLDLLGKQQSFFRDHLVQWIDPLCDRLFQEARSPYFQGVAKMARGFVSWDYREIVSRFFE